MPLSQFLKVPSDLSQLSNVQSVLFDAEEKDCFPGCTDLHVLWLIRPSYRGVKVQQGCFQRCSEMARGPKSAEEAEPTFEKTLHQFGWCPDPVDCTATYRPTSP